MEPSQMEPSQMEPSAGSQASYRMSALRILAFVGVNCLMIAGLHGVFSGRAGPSGPRLGLDSYCILNLGKGRPGTVLSGTFVLHNEGGAPLEFELTPSCNCSHLDPRTGSIPPRGRQTIRVALKLQGDGETSAQVQIGTNDPSDPVRTYILAATAVPELTVTPRSIDFGRVSAVGLASTTATVREVIVRPGEVEGGRRLGPGDIRVEEAGKHVTIERVNDGSAVKLRVSLPSNRPRGRVEDVIVLSTVGGTRVVVPVTAEVVGPVSVAPVALRLEGKDATFVVWRPDGGPLGPVTRVVSPAGVQVEEVPAGGGGGVARRRTFRVVPGAGIRPAAGVVTVTLDGLAEAVEVQVGP